MIKFTCKIRFKTLRNNHIRIKVYIQHLPAVTSARDISPVNKQSVYASCRHVAVCSTAHPRVQVVGFDSKVPCRNFKGVAAIICWKLNV